MSNLYLFLLGHEFEILFILIFWWNPMFWYVFSDSAMRDIKGWGERRNEMSHQPQADIDMTKKKDLMKLFL